MIRLLSPSLVRQVSKSTVQQQNRSFSFLKKLDQFKTDKRENDAYSSFVGRRIRDPNDQLVLEQDLTPEQQERLEILRRERSNLNPNQIVEVSAAKSIKLKRMF